MTKKNKRTAGYAWSADSLKSSAEFGYASRLASALKNALAPLVFNQYTNVLHKRLQGRITKAIGRGPEAMKGRRTLAEGDVSMLKGLELNAYTKLSALTYSLPIKVLVLAEEDALRIELQAMGPSHFRWPDRAQEAYLNVRCHVVDIQGPVVGDYVLEPRVITKRSTGSQPQRARVETCDLENRIVVVAVGVSFFRTDSEGYDGLISHNRKYYAAQIIEAAYVKNGKVVVFEHDDQQLSAKPPSVSTVPVIKWDEGEDTAFPL